MKKFKRHRDYGFFDQDIRLTKLSELGDPLEKLNNHIDFELFRDYLNSIVNCNNMMNQKSLFTIMKRLF